MKRIVIAALASAAALTGACSGAKSPDSVERMPTNEFNAAVKAFLVSNPAVLQEALAAVEELERSQTFERLLAEDDDPVIGPADAPITIVEFFDYNCGYCRQANDWLFEQVDGREGDIRVIFKEYPILAQTSLEATKAAIAAERQGKYREMHVALMKSPDLSEEGLAKTAKSVGLDMDRYKADIADEKILAHIQRVYEEADAVGVEGTPGFFVNGAFHNGFRKETMEKLLKDARAQT